MDQNGLIPTILVHFGLIPTWILAFARPKWTEMVHFGPFWPEEVHFGPFRSANRTLVIPDFIESRGNRPNASWSRFAQHWTEVQRCSLVLNTVTIVSAHQAVVPRAMLQSKHVTLEVQRNILNNSNLANMFQSVPRWAKSSCPQNYLFIQCGFLDQGGVGKEGGFEDISREFRNFPMLTLSWRRGLATQILWTRILWISRFV